jgi:hypothetical protein
VLRNDKRREDDGERNSNCVATDIALELGLSAAAAVG